MNSEMGIVSPNWFIYHEDREEARHDELPQMRDES